MALALGLYGSLSINFNYLAFALTDASRVAGLVRSKSRSEITGIYDCCQPLCVSRRVGVLVSWLRCCFEQAEVTRRWRESRRLFSGSRWQTESLIDTSKESMALTCLRPHPRMLKAAA